MLVRRTGGRTEKKEATNTERRERWEWKRKGPAMPRMPFEATFALPSPRCTLLWLSPWFIRPAALWQVVFHVAEPRTKCLFITVLRTTSHFDINGCNAVLWKTTHWAWRTGKPSHPMGLIWFQGSGCGGGKTSEEACKGPGPFTGNSLTGLAAHFCKEMAQMVFQAGAAWWHESTSGKVDALRGHTC